MPRSTSVPPKILASLRAICSELPETYEEAAWVGTRWMIRKKNFAHVVQIEDGWPPVYAREAGGDGLVLTFRAAGLLYDTLRTTGAPYFQPAWGTQWGTKVIGMRLGARVDWDEVAVLVTESYRLLAPPKLAAALAAPQKRRR